MNILFFGDSLTSGENNGGVSFVEKLTPMLEFSGNKVSKLGISGTTVGEYSIYPVDGYSLLSQIKRHEELIKTEDVIFIEYGINDITAVVAENVTHRQVIISVIKAFDYIRQLNPNCVIYWIALSDEGDVVRNYATLQVDYLYDDYLEGYIERTSTARSEVEKSWEDEYKKLMCDISYKCYVMPLITKDILLNHLDVDKIHPDDTGYELLAKNILESCNLR